VEIQIPGCKVNTEYGCEECKEDLILHPNKERCLKRPSHNNCLAYGFLECLECEEGYIFNPNYFYEKILSDENKEKPSDFL